MFTQKCKMIFLALCVVGCTFLPEARAVGYDGKVLNVGLYLEPSSLDPHIATSQDIGVAQNTYESFWRLGQKFEKIPELAKSWEMSKDGKVHTFYLRKGVKFHDGTDFNAQAVEFNIKRILHFKRGYAFILDKLDRVEIVDDYTVRFHFKQPDIGFETGVFSLRFVSPTDVKNHEKKEGDYAGDWYVDKGVGTGPYKLLDWTHGTKIYQEKFDGYWRGWKGKHVEKIYWWVINEQATQRMMLEKGELDHIFLFSTDYLPQFRANPEIVVEERISPVLLYCRMNNAVGPTKDIKVRKALSYAFDRKKYDEVLGFKNPPSSGPISSVVLGNWEPKNLIREFDLKKADQLLTEAGYPPGKRFELEFVYIPGDDLKRKMGEVLQLRLAEIGVTINLSPATWANQYARLVAWKEKKAEKGAIGLWAWNRWPDLPNAYGMLNVVYGKDGARNLMGYENHEVWGLIEESAATVNEKKRMELWRKATQLVADDVPDIFISSMPDWGMHRKWMKGFSFDPLATNYLYCYDVHKEK